MFFCIIGVFITVASDSVYTYHVSVRTLFDSLKNAGLNSLDCWVSSGRSSLYDIVCQFSGLLK